MSMPEIDILVKSRLWGSVPGARAMVIRAAEAVAASLGKEGPFQQGDEIGVTLLDDVSIAALNRRWRGKDAPTNVLSFPAPQHQAIRIPRLLGDIVLAFETVEREAKAQGKAIDDHLAHLVVHGLLHLLGYDHMKKSEARRMEALEIGILATIGVADPYAIKAA
jgi:probable rRNA maturation factor